MSFDIVTHLKAAQMIVENSPHWHKFIDGTPLSNDIAVWMAEFAHAAVEEALERDREPAMRKELAAHIATLTITSENIGDIRRSLFMPFDCDWNGWVRELTAEKENQ